MIKLKQLWISFKIKWHNHSIYATEMDYILGVISDDHLQEEITYREERIRLLKENYNNLTNSLT